MTMGVYCIQIEKDNYWQSYVGISKNVENRWSRHKVDLKGNYHSNQYLQSSWNKYKEENFEFSILEEIDCYNDLYKIEKEYADAFGYGDFELCFNIGTPGEKSPMFDKHHTEETKRKLSEASKGENNHNFGKRFSEETKQKLRKAHQGEKGSNVKLTELDARFILTVKTTRKNKYNADFKQRELANYFGVSISCIEQVMQRTTWKHIEPLSIEEYEKFKQEIQNST